MIYDLTYSDWEHYVDGDGNPHALDWSSVTAMRGKPAYPYVEALRQAVLERFPGEDGESFLSPKTQQDLGYLKGVINAVSWLTTGQNLWSHSGIIRPESPRVPEFYGGFGVNCHWVRPDLSITQQPYDDNYWYQTPLGMTGSQLLEQVNTRYGTDYERFLWLDEDDYPLTHYAPWSEMILQAKQAISCLTYFGTTTYNLGFFRYGEERNITYVYKYAVPDTNDDGFAVAPWSNDEGAEDQYEFGPELAPKVGIYRVLENMNWWDNGAIVAGYYTGGFEIDSFTEKFGDVTIPVYPTIMLSYPEFGYDGGVPYVCPKYPDYPVGTWVLNGSATCINGTLDYQFESSDTIDGIPNLGNHSVGTPWEEYGWDDFMIGWEARYMGFVFDLSQALTFGHQMT